MGFRLKQKNDITLCIFGDGAAEEDYVLASLGFAGSKKLRILFICEDNDMSVNSYMIGELENSWGQIININACEITDDPLLIKIKLEYKDKLPALIKHVGMYGMKERDLMAILYGQDLKCKTFLSKKHKINVKK